MDLEFDKEPFRMVYGTFVCVLGGVLNLIRPYLRYLVMVLDVFYGFATKNLIRKTFLMVSVFWGEG